MKYFFLAAILISISVVVAGQSEKIEHQKIAIKYLQNNEDYTYRMLQSCADMAYNAKEINGQMVPQPATFESFKACIHASFLLPPKQENIYDSN